MSRARRATTGTGLDRAVSVPSSVLVPSPVLVAVVVLGAGYGATVREEVTDLVVHQGGRPDGWAVFLSSLADPYSTIALLLPAAAVLGVRHVAPRGHLAALVRHGSRARWLVATTRTGLLPVGSLLAAWCLACLLPTAGLPWSSGFQRTALIAPDSSSLLPHLTASGLSPQVLAGAGVVVLGTGLLTGLVVLATVAVLVGEHRQHGTVLLAAAVAGPVVFLVCFKTSALPPWGDPSQLLLLTPATALAGGPWSALAPWALVATSCWALLRWQHRLACALDRARQVARSVPLHARPWLVHAAAVLFGLIGLRAASARWEPASASVWDGPATALYTASPDGAAGVLWMFSALVGLGHGYVVVLQLDRAFGPQSLHALLRHTSPGRWVARHVRGPLLGAAALPALLVVVTGGLQAAELSATDRPWHLTGHGGRASAVLPGVPPEALAYQLVVNGALQQLVVVLAVVLACVLSSASRSALSSGTARPSLWPLAVLVAFLVASAPGLADHGVLPAGLGGAGHATGGWPAVARHTAVLGATAVALACAVVLAVRRLSPRHLLGPAPAPALSTTRPSTAGSTS